ncbi:MAG TPA: DUF2089 domain-containing protein [Candidatus Limnocylindrales bacterium]
MAHDVIATCPVCSSELRVTRLECRACGTSIEGDFTVGRFGRLGRDQLALLESFLRARGNLREMERELGLSYPTVRARVDALVRAVGLWTDDGAGHPAEEESGEAAAVPEGTPSLTAAAALSGDDATARRDVLERLARHEIDADEAAAAIRSLGGRY